MRKFTIIIALSLAALYFHVQGQDGPVRLSPSIIPPSPTASELGRYGLVPVGLSTGTINPEVALHTFKTKNISLPISMAYNSSGVKVDEISSWTGMHWSLNSGGVVSRIVRDDADFASGVDIPYPPNFDMRHADAVSYIEKAGNALMDTEPDLFTFNFLGYTGKFVFDRNGEVIGMPRNDLRIERTVNSGPGNFVITTPDGIKCTFDAAETTVMQVSNDASFPPAVTSWYLTKIEHPLGDVINLTYLSSSHTYYVGFSQSYAKNTQRNLCNRGGEMSYCMTESSSFSITSLYVTVQRLSKIEATGYGSMLFQSTMGRSDLNDYKLDGFTVKDVAGRSIKEVSFSYVFSNNPQLPGAIDYAEELKHRMFLTGITEKDATGTLVRKHDFEYDDINGLPARLSYAQDHWGYFNGASNYSFLPTNLEERDYLGGPAFAGIGGNRELNTSFAGKGMLRKITYPTAGTSTFTYGPNTYYTEKTLYPPLSSVSLYCSGRESTLPVVKTVTITNPVAQQIRLQAASALLPGYTSTQSGATIYVTDASGNVVAGQALVLNQGYTAYVQLQANQQYTFTLTATTSGDDENNTSNTMYFEYYATAPQKIFDNVETGGMRINEVANYDPVTSKTEKIKYYYASHDQLSKSSGQIAGMPSYITRYTLKTPCTPAHCSYWECPYVALHSNNTSNLFLSNSNIYYRYVTVGRGDNMEAGAEEHEFSVRFDNAGIQMWGTDYIKDAPLSNTGWDNNKETDVRYYAKKNGTFVLLKHIHRDFVKDARYHKEVPALAVRKKYEPVCTQDAIFQCDASNINLVFQYYTCTAQHTHFNTSPLPWEPDEWICRAPGARNEWVTYYRHPCYGKQVGETAVLAYALDYLDALEYRNISEWVYVDKTTETIYDEDGANPVVKETDYSYDNASHMQLSKVATNTSDNKAIEVQTKYPEDYNTSNQVISSLLSKHIVNVPIKKETTSDGKQISGEVTIYNVNGQPSNIYQFESRVLNVPAAHDGNQFVPSSNYKLKSTIAFDPATNNVSKVQLTNNFSTVYLWGYQNTLPIAEIKNAVNASRLVDYNATNTVSADISISSPETALWPTFEIFTAQSITPALFVSPNGSGAPSSPLLTVVLKKSDGTWVTSHNAVWGDNNMGSITLPPGVYQWYYFGGDIVFDQNFTGFGFSITTNYVGRKTAYTVFHTSFEEDGTGNSSAKTGTKVWSGPYSVSVPGEDGKYKLSYWRKSGTTPWELVEQIVTITSGTPQTIAIGDHGILTDEVRLHPVAAQMTTYTYDPQIGMTSVTDANNITTYQAYDNFGRLKMIKDQHQDVVKTIEYNYTIR